ncbi:DUF3993 domain-containing protein [Litchfieldia salsa]
MYTVLIIGTNVTATSTEEPLDRDKVFSLLKEGFQAQVSLSEYIRTYEEINEILETSFTKDFISKFLDENLFEEGDGFIIYGSDFAPYYIPYFSYSERTKFVYDSSNQKYYVYEKFDASNDGPVSYNEHYALITIQQDGLDWKISDITINEELNKDILELKEQVTEEVPVQSKQSKGESKSVKKRYEPVENMNRFLLFSDRILEMEYKYQRFSPVSPL